MSEPINEAINEHLVEQNERLEKELQDLHKLLNRPITVDVKSPDSQTLRKVGEYLPQLTHMSTNLAHAASALQAMTGAILASVGQLERIANILEERDE